jgi:hypothetical protein
VLSSSTKRAVRSAEKAAAKVTRDVERVSARARRERGVPSVHEAVEAASFPPEDPEQYAERLRRSMADALLSYRNAENGSNGDSDEFVAAMLDDETFIGARALLDAARSLVMARRRLEAAEREYEEAYAALPLPANLEPE